MKFYAMEKEEVLQNMQSHEEGLSAQEAASRLEEKGKNKLQEGKKITLAERFLAQLKDPMILILIAAAIISGITAGYSVPGCRTCNCYRSNRLNIIILNIILDSLH